MSGVNGMNRENELLSWTMWEYIFEPLYFLLRGQLCFVMEGFIEVAEYSHDIEWALGTDREKHSFQKRIGLYVIPFLFSQWESFVWPEKVLCHDDTNDFWWCWLHFIFHLYTPNYCHCIWRKHTSNFGQLQAFDILL